MIDWNKRIWQHWSPDGRKRWPIDQQGFIYLLRAMDPIGKAVFGAEWKDTEQAEQPNISLREQIGDSSLFTPMPQTRASYEQKFQVYFLLRRHYNFDDRKLPPLNDGPLAFSDEQWQVALALAEEEDRRRTAARERALRVHATIRDAVLEGAMATALRDIDGGALSSPLPAAKFWASEKLWPRFGLGQLDVLDPFGPYPALPYRDLMDQARRGRKGVWRLIYVEANGLERLLGKLGGSISQEPEVHLLPTSKKARRPRTAAKSLSIQEYAKAKWPDGVRNIPRTHRIKQINDHLASIGIKEGASPPTIDKALLALYGADKF